MANFNISGSEIPDSCRNVADLVLPDPADDTSPLISFSPVETWTDSPLNSTTAPVRPQPVTACLTPIPVALPAVIAHIFFSQCICNYPVQR